ncbi:MAG: FadR family transcriptional regulator [Rhizorhabdus sp.]|nr:FadR family transcriptional regulator [Rhizorhabdus sp.]TAK16771.1 MAG: FadR family transcriptional regulator [Rhizorhabdus sp.]
MVEQLIENKIVQGEIAIGEVLPSELALASQLGVNRSTVREAIRLLEQNGLVRRKQGGKKLFVSVPDRSKLSKRLQTTMILQEVTFRELSEVMAELEPMAAAAAALKISPETRDRIADNLERTKANLHDRRLLTELDIEFHDLIAEAADNRALQASHEAISGLFYPAFLEVLTKLNAGERLLLAHQKIFDAITAGDDREARSWMSRHIDDFQRGCELANMSIDEKVTRESTFIEA